MKAQTMDNFLTHYEAEHLIEQIHEIDIKEYGSKDWFKQHESIDRLNIQAHVNALGGMDEFVMEQMVTADKISPLVMDLLVSETWKAKVFPLIKDKVADLSSIKSYMCLYHEASIVNLLEVMLYHRTACEGSEDALVEIIDYCYRKFVEITNNADFYYKRQKEAAVDDPKAYMNMTSGSELERNASDIEFQCAMIGFSLIRFISDHLSDLTVPVVH
jgi:zinc finger MYND domain-containing protein 10